MSQYWDCTGVANPSWRKTMETWEPRASAAMVLLTFGCNILIPTPKELQRKSEYGEDSGDTASGPYTTVLFIFISGTRYSVLYTCILHQTMTLQAISIMYDVIQKYRWTTNVQSIPISWSTDVLTLHSFQISNWNHFNAISQSIWIGLLWWHSPLVAQEINDWLQTWLQWKYTSVMASLITINSVISWTGQRSALWDLCGFVVEQQYRAFILSSLSARTSYGVAADLPVIWDSISPIWL